MERLEPASLDTLPGMERLAVRSRQEVFALLDDLRSRQAPLMLQYGDEQALAPARILSLKPAYEEMLLEAEPARLPAIVSTGSVSAEAALDAIRIQFSTGHAEALHFRDQSQPLLRLRAPDTLVRLQRRDTLRAPTPDGERPWLTVRMPGRNAPALRLEVTDISMGGLGLRIPDPQATIETGLTLRDARIELPGVGVLGTGVEFMYVSNPEPGSGERHAGARFAGLPPATLVHVQRYVIRLERLRQSQAAPAAGALRH